MISNLRLQAFKCFADQTVHFGKLSLLAGENATGKSSVIQALLLLRQAYEQGNLQKGELPLSGDLVNLGPAREAFRHGSEEEAIVITLTAENSQDSFTCELSIKETELLDSYLLSTSRAIKDNDSNLFWPQFTYLQAERLGPRLTYPMTDQSPETMRVGIQGEFTAHVLAQFGIEKQVDKKALQHPDAKSPTLRHQTEAWMGNIVPNLQLNTEAIREADIVRLEFKNQSSISADFLRPTNIGFGISYTLPVIVGGLVAKPSSLFIVENPEAHLHPKGQSEMGNFLARAAAAGVQVVVETHSEHILNGIRLAVRKGIIAPDNISIQFFTTDLERQIITPQLYSDGRIDKWPHGFFDQAEKDLMELL